MDPRIVTFRAALEALLESLDATVRVARWRTEDEGPLPDPLRASAAQLQDRLGSANRLAAGRFVGAPAVVANSDAIRSAVQSLDAAFVTYRKTVDGQSTDREAGVLALDAEIGRIRLDAHRWE